LRDVDDNVLYRSLPGFASPQQREFLAGAERLGVLQHRMQATNAPAVSDQSLERSRLHITNRSKRPSDHFRVADNLSETLVIISRNPVSGPWPLD
jgi:hypothetical protein